MIHKLLCLLADGCVHSGADLGAKLGLSRAAVNKQVAKLRQYGLLVASVKGKGYQLLRPFDLLDDDAIRQKLHPVAARMIREVSIHWSIDSTNSEALRYLRTKNESGFVCLAETQSGGRGRRGRSWASPLGSGIYLSLTWVFDGGFEVLQGLSIAVGIEVCRVLRMRTGCGDVGVKWPNDIFYKDRKLGGILIEMSGESEGPCAVVVGVGLNTGLLLQDESIDQPYTDISSITDVAVLRNELAADVISAVLMLLGSYANGGFAHYRAEWHDFDVFADKTVFLRNAERIICHGVSRGLSASGALMMEIDGLAHEFASGEVSLRRE